MSEGNGKIVSLADGTRGRKFTLTNAQRAEVERIAHDMVIQECAKVHEFYMGQIPAFMANMIVDALVDRKLIEEFRTGPMATPEAPVVSENAGGDTAPSDSIPPVDPAA